MMKIQHHDGVVVDAAGGKGGAKCKGAAALPPLLFI